MINCLLIIKPVFIYYTICITLQYTFRASPLHHISYGIRDDMIWLGNNIEKYRICVSRKLEIISPPSVARMKIFP